MTPLLGKDSAFANELDMQLAYRESVSPGMVRLVIAIFGVLFVLFTLHGPLDTRDSLTPLQRLAYFGPVWRLADPHLLCGRGVDPLPRPQPAATPDCAGTERHVAVCGRSLRRYRVHRVCAVPRGASHLTRVFHRFTWCARWTCGVQRLSATTCCACASDGCGHALRKTAPRRPGPAPMPAALPATHLPTGSPVPLPTNALSSHPLPRTRLRSGSASSSTRPGSRQTARPILPQRRIRRRFPRRRQSPGAWRKQAPATRLRIPGARPSPISTRSSSNACPRR